MTAAALKQASPQSTRAINIDGVTANYGRGNVIENVSFDVRMGDTFGLIGLNGVGKTTLIKIILGLMEATQGSASLFGKVTLDPQSKAMIAYLPEKFEPPFFLTGLEFVKFSLDLYNRPFNEKEVLAAA